MFEYANPEQWSDFRLEQREAELRDTDGKWLTQERRAVRGREAAHILFELDMRYAEQDVLEAVEKVVERGTPEVAQ